MRDSSGLTDVGTCMNSSVPGSLTTGQPGLGLASWYTAGRTDGFGDRLLMFDNTGAASFELLRFRPELARERGFEDLLRQRVQRLASFKHPSFAAVRAVEHLEEGNGLALVSTYTPGKRLSELLETPRTAPGLHPAFVSWLVQQLTPLVAALQGHGYDIVHGALTIDRIVLTPEGGLTIVEHVLGSALRGLEISPMRMWREFAIVTRPTSRGEACVDARGDILQIGTVALSLLLGRRITLQDVQDRLATLLDEFSAMPAARASLFAAPLRQWLERALQLHPQAYRSAAEAQEGLRQLPEQASSLPGLLQSMVLSPGQLPEPPDELALLAPAPESTAPPLDTVENAALPEVMAFVPDTDAIVSPRPLTVDINVKVDTSSEIPEPITTLVEEREIPLEAHDHRDDTAATDDSVGATESTAAAEILPVDPAPTPIVYPTAVAATAAALEQRRESIAEAFRHPMVAEPSPQPAQASAVVRHYDDRVTERTRDAKPFTSARVPSHLPSPGASSTGSYLLVGVVLFALAEAGIIAMLTLRRPAAQPVAAVVPTPTPVTIEASRPGLTVLVNNQPAGTTPLQIAVSSATKSIRIEADSNPAATAPAAAVPPPPAATPQPRTGGVRFNSPLNLQVLEGNRVLGSAGDTHTLAPGSHQLDLVNNDLGFRTRQVVNIVAGETATFTVATPTGRLSVNAQPWAQVWVDQNAVGETPIANLAVPIGQHQVIFRHPQLGERTETVTVRADVVTRLTTTFGR